MVSKQMQLKDRIGYIWDYYKLWIIGAVAIIGLSIYLVGIFTRPRTVVAFEAAFVNCYDNVSDNSDIARGFDKYLKGRDLGSSNVEGKIVYDNNLFFNLSRNSDYKNSYYQKLVAYLETGTYDAVICEYDNLVGIGQSGRFLDLRDERIKSVYDKYGDYAIYIETDEGNIPIGIDISNSPVIAKMNSFGNGCYLAFSSNSSHYEMDELFLEYLFGK
jgi:hypothetical protein